MSIAFVLGFRKLTSGIINPEQLKLKVIQR
jgi:hypothetical protein